MGWLKIENPYRLGKAMFVGAAIGTTTWRGRPKYSIGLAVSALPKGWKKRDRVSVEIGTDQYHRKLRITRTDDGAFALMAAANTERVLSIWVPIPSGVDAGNRNRQQVPIVRDQQADAVILTLPEWAVPKVRAATDISASLMGDPKPGRRA